MANINVSTYMSLDGYVEEPGNWSLPYFDDDSAEYAKRQLFASSSLLLGRKTYQDFAKAWPGRGGTFADRMNAMPKYVVSDTLEKADWTNTTVISGDIVSQLAELRDRPGDDVLVYGSTELVHTLIQEQLLTELRMWIHPVLMGDIRADVIFARDDSRAKLRLVETTTLVSGVIIAAYGLS